MSDRTLAAWAGVVWLVAILLMLSAGSADTLERCPDGYPRQLGTCLDE